MRTIKDYLPAFALALLLGCTSSSKAEPAGSLTGSLQGRVTTLKSGLGLAGVKVSTQTPAGTVSTTTGDDGSYVLAGLPSGANYSVHFAKDGFAPMLAAAQITPAPATDGQANALATLDQIMTQADASISGVVSTGGVLLAGATLNLDLRSIGYELVSSATVGQDGSFLFDGLPGSPAGLPVTVMFPPWDQNGDGVAEYSSAIARAILYPGTTTKILLQPSVLTSSSAHFQLSSSDIDSGTHAADAPLHFTFTKPLDLLSTLVTVQEVSSGYPEPIVAVQTALDDTQTILAVSPVGGASFGTGHQYYVSVHAVSTAGEQYDVYGHSFTAGAGGERPGPVAGLAVTPSKIDYNSTAVTLSWAALEGADRYAVYARDTASNPAYVLLSTVGSAPAPGANVTLPSGFDWYTGDGMQTPFAWGTQVDFLVIAISDAGASGDLTAATPVRIGDNTAPTVLGTIQTGNAQNTTGAASTVQLKVNFDEYMDSAVTPTIALPLAQESATFAMDSSLRFGTFTIGIPANTDGSGAYTISGAKDTSGNTIPSSAGRIYREQQLIMNGGFESGLTGWTATQTSTASAPAAVSSPTATGSGAARLGSSGSAQSGSSTLYQDVALPAGASDIVLSLSWRGFTNSNYGDVVNCGAYTTGGSSLASVLSYQATTSMAAFTTPMKVHLTQWAGQTVRIQCQVTEYGSYASGIWLDDVSLIADL